MLTKTRRRLKPAIIWRLQWL